MSVTDGRGDEQVAADVLRLLKLPTNATKSGADYWRRVIADLELRASVDILEHQVSRLTKERDQFYNILQTYVTRVATGIGKTADDWPAFAKMEDTLESSTQYLRETSSEIRNSFNSISSEIWVSRSIDNFLTYASDVLSEVLITRPEIMRSNRSVTLQEVLIHHSLDAFVKWAAEDIINELSHKGLRDISDFIKSRLGLVLVEDESVQARLSTAIAARNAITHRRGVIDHKFVASAGKSYGSVGERINCQALLDDKIGLVDVFVVGSFDRKIAAKFDLSFGSCEIPPSWLRPLLLQLRNGKV